MSLNSCNNVGKLVNYQNITSSVALSLTGNKLVYSNFPESFSDYNTAENKKYFYRDPSVRGRARVFFHHSNGSSNTYKLVVRVRNRNGFPVNIYTNRTGSASSEWAVVAGGYAWENWLASSGTDTYRTTISSNQTFDLIQQNVPGGHSTGGVVDYVATDSSGNLANVEITVFAALYPSSITSSMMDTWGYDQNTDWNYSQKAYGKLVRGTFNHSSRNAVININTHPSMSSCLVLGHPTTSVGLTNEYEQGWDYTQNCSVWVAGNYGIDYNLQFNINDSATRKGNVYGYLQDSGFPNYYVIRNNGAYSGCNKNNLNVAWNFDSSFTGYSTITKNIWYTLTGGNASPVEIHWA
ncbi:hypothetical protein [Paenibacillus puerhi]|uniref:hypothetical protein n=1 Tax=Paenibacillus puerhi TaxID=2692622 RepID=UPI0013567B7C|nr:hypothetical protein [Paenibacillus puerhi]